jgi:hypothetical protein
VVYGGLDLGFLRVKDAGERALYAFFYSSKLSYCE